MKAMTGCLTAVQAWEQLKVIGGLDLGGRDSDLEPKLLAALPCAAETLTEALDRSSTDELVRALLNAVSPYVEMFSAILKFFESAKASQGRAQWSVVIEDQHLELRHFVEFLQTWESFDCEFDVPAIDSKGAWAVRRAADGIPELELSSNARKISFAGLNIEGIEQWGAMLDEGRYTSLPRALQSGALPCALQDASAILEASIQIARATWPDREAMLEALRQRQYRHDSTDGFDAWTIAQHETDLRLRTSVAMLGRALVSEPAVLHAYERSFRQLIRRYERRRLGVRASVEDLQQVLSLPVWQRRHELYAVWIATEIVAAVPEHDIELHHNNGKISISFGGSIVATIHSRSPKVRLHAERRSPLHMPLGHGRKAGVQPDYTLWQGAGSAESCGLVIEVKHYKSDAPSRFHEVITDYARAHSQATVLLVSHGPAREYIYDRNAQISSRCHTIGELTVNHLDRREVLAQHVRKFVGVPVLVAIDLVRECEALIVDVSLSMASAFKSAEMADLLEEFSSCIDVALVDTSIRERCDFSKAIGLLASLQPGGGTSLEGPVREMLRAHAKVLVVTDADGHRKLSSLGALLVREQRIGSVDARLLSICR